MNSIVYPHVPTSRRAGLVPGAAPLFGLLLFAGCGPSYPDCNNDSDCQEAEYCVNGRCQQCRPGEDDCPAGQECNEGRCDPIEGYCESDADCPTGQECQGQRCAAVQQAAAPEPPPAPEPPQCSLAPVYFAYDSSSLEGGAGSTLESNAQCIRSRSFSRVQLTGHCDPRGTEEYNLALGERRAQAVRAYLERLGVSSSIDARSMGEEMARGESEAGWERDRRVEISGQ